MHHLLTSGAANVEPAARSAIEGLARSLADFIAKDPLCSAWEPYDNGRECRGGGTYTDMRFELDGRAPREMPRRASRCQSLRKPRMSEPDPGASGPEGQRF